MTIENKYYINLEPRMMLFSGGYSGEYNGVYPENFHRTLSFIINKIKRK